MKMTDTTDSRPLLEDHRIIDLYWQREERAITETDRKYGRYLYTIAYNILHNDPDSEECLNDTYFGTWNAIPPAKPTFFQVFLSKIMRNTAVVRYKKNHAKSRVPSEMTVSLDELDGCIPYEPSVADDYEVYRLSRLLSDYLRKMPEKRAFIFVCRYYCADRIMDIASMLHVSESTVYRELDEIKKGLREILIKEGFINA
ncbi:MAG: sigma-70 family RNA polymerase sigma factor [Clostridia bacterium]|nr:sigma-70 family RNA polymerase sigma factor [Oscillospiraceae bacterium]MBR2446335.1 sigma-70 family RNA polymerase sigma factor [Clostridia bacterium]